MKTIVPYIHVIRPGNALMAGCAVLLGFWLSNAHGISDLLLLTIAAVSATGFGNIINDIKDLPSDRISHPDRPLVTGNLKLKNAWIYLIALGLLSLAVSSGVSRYHLLATLLPLLFLILYARWLKGTPLIGNVLVALLVAYPLLFGGLTAVAFNRLLIPAALAFLLNLSREIVKDVQDEQGDTHAGLSTSASVPVPLLKGIVFTTGVIYLILLFLPYLFHQFGFAYLLICSGAVLPIHCLWNGQFFSKTWRSDLKSISGLIKLEMIFGLIALAVDQVLAILSIVK